MSDTNKVEFGLKNVHVGTYTVDDATGRVTMGAPFKLPGAVNLSLDPETEEVKSYADDVIYYADYSDNGFSGSLNTRRDLTSISRLKGMATKKNAEGSCITSELPYHQESTRQRKAPTSRILSRAI